MNLQKKYTHSELFTHMHSFQLSSYLLQGTKVEDAGEDDNGTTIDVVYDDDTQLPHVK
jgi:hypothetical protein